MIRVAKIELIWLMFLQVAQITDLNRVPNTSDPNHKDVKAILTLYSMESFLYRRINLIQREKVEQSILTLGPYAVALTRII